MFVIIKYNMIGHYVCNYKIQYDMLYSYLRKVHYCAFHLKHGGVR